MGLRGAGTSFLQCCRAGNSSIVGELALEVSGGFGVDAEPVAMRTTLREAGGRREDGTAPLLHACATGPVPPARAVAWAAALLDGAAPTQVLVLEQLPKPLLRLPGGVEAEAPLLRALATDAFPTAQLCAPALEAPNMLDGAAAALLTACQMHGVAAAVYASVLEPGSTLTMRAYEPLLPMVAPGLLLKDVAAGFDAFAPDVDTLSAQARESLYM